MTNDLPSVGTEDARPMSTEGARVHADFLDFAGLDKAANVIRALVSERDELASRVRELEGDAKRWRRLVNASEMPFPPATVANDPENDATLLYGRARLERYIDDLDEIPNVYASKEQP